METNFISKLGILDMQGYVRVLNAYIKNCQGEDIQEVGFNQNTGYVYIALENGVQIASCLDNFVEYIVTDYNSGEEHFFCDYEEDAYIKALTFHSTLNN